MCIISPGVALPDLDQAHAFLCSPLGFDVVGRVVSHPANVVSDDSVLLTLWQTADPLMGRVFDRRADIGLHHLSLATGDSILDALDDAFVARLSGSQSP